MGAAERAAALDRYRQLTDEGLRVIGVAYRTLPARHAYGKEDEQDLVFAGFLAFSDPLLPGVASILAQLAADGVAVKILTGDSDAAARHVCAKVAFGPARVVTGDDIARMNDD